MSTKARKTIGDGLDSASQGHSAFVKVVKVDRLNPVMTGHSIVHDAIAPAVQAVTSGMSPAEMVAVWTGVTAALCGVLIASIGHEESVSLVKGMPKSMRKLIDALKSEGGH